jgi:hypothetical protein
MERHSNVIGIPAEPTAEAMEVQQWGPLATVEKFNFQLVDPCRAWSVLARIARAC